MIKSESQTKTKLDTDTSRAITGVRFLLIVFVVFIHNVITDVNFAGGVVTVEVPLAVDFIRTLVSDIFGSMAVPTFFFVSGYLLFFKNDPYPVMLKKKCRSILIPYLLWNLLVALGFFVCQRIPALRQYFATTIIEELDFKGWLELFAGRDTDRDGAYYPLVYQFWFLRDLFLVMLISPAIKKLTEKMPLFFAVFLVIFLNSNWLYGQLRTAIFYVSLGAFAIRFDLSYKHLERIQFRDIGILYIKSSGQNSSP